MYRALGALILTLILAAPAEARPRVTFAHDRCNIDWPCEGVAASPRGERVARDMHGFGSARKVYTPRAEHVRSRRSQDVARRRMDAVQHIAAQVVNHPLGCPSRAFCGCGAAVRVFGAPIRALWLAANWFKFPRTAPAAGMVAVRAHHVFVLEQHLGGDTWLAYDANSGGHATRIHARSITGYAIVNPRGGSA